MSSAATSTGAGSSCTRGSIRTAPVTRGAVARCIAARTGTHYLDLTEDVATTRKVEQLATNAKSAFIPQCGLAPGFISIVAQDLTKHFDTLDSVRMRVGALPQYPSNALNYNLTWSTDGLINEYIEPCEAIVEGRLISVPASSGARLLCPAAS